MAMALRKTFLITMQGIPLLCETTELSIPYQFTIAQMTIRKSFSTLNINVNSNYFKKLVTQLSNIPNKCAKHKNLLRFNKKRINLSSFLWPYFPTHLRLYRETIYGSKMQSLSPFKGLTPRPLQWGLFASQTFPCDKGAGRRVTFSNPFTHTSSNINSV